MSQAGTQDVAGVVDEAGAASTEVEVQSSRFGTLTVSTDRIITFPRGLLGYPMLTQYALIQAGEENYFFWLQSTEEPTLAFVVTDPNIFCKGYEVPIKDETRQELELTDDALAQVFVICNKVNGWLTGNMLGPVVVNAANRTALQVVLTEKKWTTRQQLMQMRPVAVAPEAIAA
jgi:flagellar assembly factor FliW